ncbi:hypothetical protein [Actinoplanes sp. NPDC026623]|uniref:hypothetical protein n=1 Tax=Actinoplanes sp. NPDC026623 TaxID=3155610 RepID=UPI0033CCADCE
MSGPGASPTRTRSEVRPGAGPLGCSRRNRGACRHGRIVTTFGGEWPARRCTNSLVGTTSPAPHQQLAGLPWRDVQDATRGHGRREIRSLEVLTVSTGIDFPHAAQAIQIRRRRHRSDQRRFTTETVYAITGLRVHPAEPAQLAAGIRGQWRIENQIHRDRDVTYGEDRSQIRAGP